MPPAPPHGHWRWAPLLAFAAFGGSLFLKLFADQGLLWPCLFRRLTRLPCPTCGGTHCIQALLALDFPRAAAANPLLFLCALGLVAATLLAVVERLERWPLLSPEPLLRRPVLLRVLAVLLVLANWVYLILREHCLTP